MKNHRIYTISALLFASIHAAAGYEAHEWGTFTSLVGSSGVTQNGMYHEDEHLPPFVHGFGEIAMPTTPRPPEQPPVVRPRPVPTPPRRPCRGKACFDQSIYQNSVITQKMETPVIYFYSDKSERVQVNVKFPEGIITETFPAPIKTFPAKTDRPVIGKGDTTFQVDIQSTKTGSLPFVQANNIYSHARNTESNLVRNGSEQEKFIFYRGLGRFQPHMRITSERGSLKILPPAGYASPAAFLIDVSEQGACQILNLGSLNENSLTSVSASKIAALRNHSNRDPSAEINNLQQSRTLLINALSSAGLKKDEATAMVDTWTNGYFKVPGLRLLYIVPKLEVDQNLPIKFTPAPAKLERVFVGRIEILLDTEEESLLNRITMERFGFRPETLGRFAEPILRRIQQFYFEKQTEKHLAPDSQMLAVFDSLIDRAAGKSSSSPGTVH